MTDVAPDIWERIAAYLEKEGLELDDLLIVGGNEAPALRVLIDGPSSVDIDHIADLSRALSRQLEGTPYDGSAYGLEVSSPGLERSLRRPRHWEKAVGRSVVVKTRQPLDDERRHAGTIVDVSEDAASIEIEGTTRTIPYDAMTSAKTVFVWEKQPKPGKHPKEHQR